MKMFPVVISLILPCLSELSAQSPAYRPALIGNGPKSLINLIDTQKLMAAGQKDAVVMFSCVVAPGRNLSLVRTVETVTYRESANAKALRVEVQKKCADAKFIPAVYEGKSVWVVFSGAVVFSMANGAPHLRVFACQDSEGMTGRGDFVAPQLLLGTDDWEAAKKELSAAAAHLRNGAIELTISTDANGTVKNIAVLSEDPNGYNFGHAAVQEYKNAKFIPGFRNGKPVACSFTFTTLVGVIRTWRGRFHG
jgi:TonB-like protein